LLTIHASNSTINALSTGNQRGILEMQQDNGIRPNFAKLSPILSESHKSQP